MITTKTALKYAEALLEYRTIKCMLQSKPDNCPKDIYSCPYDCTGILRNVLNALIKNLKKELPPCS